MLLAYILLGGSALLIVYDDVREQNIHAIYLIAFILAGVLQQTNHPEPEGFWAAFGIAFIFFSCQGLFYFLKGEQAIGWGDLAIAPACGLWLRLHELPSFLLSAGFIALCTALIWRYRWNMRTFPLAPALLCGLGIVFLIRCFLTGNGI